MEPTEENVKTAIEKHLGIALKQSDKNLFDQGVLDSLQSVGLIVDLEKSFKVKLSVLEFAEDANFTVPKIAEIIANQRKSATRS